MSKSGSLLSIRGEFRLLALGSGFGNVAWQESVGLDRKSYSGT